MQTAVRDHIDGGVEPILERLLQASQVEQRAALLELDQEIKIALTARLLAGLRSEHPRADDTMRPEDGQDTGLHTCDCRGHPALILLDFHYSDSPQTASATSTQGLDFATAFGETTT